MFQDSMGAIFTKIWWTYYFKENDNSSLDEIIQKVLV